MGCRVQHCKDGARYHLRRLRTWSSRSFCHPGLEASRSKENRWRRHQRRKIWISQTGLQCTITIVLFFFFDPTHILYTASLFFLHFSPNSRPAKLKKSAKLKKFFLNSSETLSKTQVSKNFNYDKTKNLPISAPSANFLSFLQINTNFST